MNKNHSKRLLSFPLTFALLFTMAPAAFAADTTTEEHVHEEVISAAEPEEPVADPVLPEEEAAETPPEPVPEEVIEEPAEEEIEEAPSAEPATSGTVGDSSVCWELNTSTGQLIISGSGGCDTFSSAADQPWAHLRNEIREVYFMDISSLSISNLAYWFDGCSNLKTAGLPYTTLRIGTRAFADCPNLTTIITNYYDADEIAIAPGAFAVSSPTDTRICLITDQPLAIWRVMSYDWAADNRNMQAIDVHDAELLIGDRGISGCDCSGCDWYTEASEYNLDTDKNSDTKHWVYTFCSDCDAFVYHGYEEHSFSGGECTECGYVEECDHSWKVDYYEPYSSTKHYIYYYCRYCDETDYEKEYHTEAYDYNKYNSSQHEAIEYCEDCEDELDSYYESHDFSYGSWSNYSATQHRRQKTCNDCGYSTYEYASHGLSYGSWTSASSSQHSRTASCTSCSYSTTETASHALSYGSWTSVSDTQHKRTVSCSGCSYSTSQTASHSFTYVGWTSISAEEHERTTSCSCGYSGTETAPHVLSAGDWVACSAEEHERTDTCSCGYAETLAADHADNDDNGFCDDCNYAMTRFSVTVPATMILVVSENGEVYTAENVSIVNNSSDDVEVTDVTISAAGSWTLVPYTHNMAAEKVDAKCIGFSLNDAQGSVTGNSEDLALNGDWTIDKSGELPLAYDAVVSATSEILREEQVLSLVFIVDWAA